MTPPLRIGVIGEYNARSPSHAATIEALGRAAHALGRTCECTWLPTDALDSAEGEAGLARYDALWGAPGGPYASMEGALRGIRYAREHDRPFIGA